MTLPPAPSLPRRSHISKMWRGVSLLPLREKVAAKPSDEGAGSVRRFAAAPLAALATAALLTGCISVLPKENPAQLYRFGAPAVANIPTPPPGQVRFTVLMTPLSFDRAAAGDRILTMNGQQAAYIRGSRWVTSANALFEAATVSAFDADDGPARVLARGEAAHPDYALKLDVRSFEARYEQGPAAPPTVVIELYAALGQLSDRTPVGERIFRATVPAADNRVGAIAAAYDQAVRKVLGEMVTWVDAKGAG